MQFGDANWKVFDYFNSADGDEFVEVPLTQTMIDWMTGAQNDGWSKTAFIIQGDKMTITSIKLLP